MDRAPASRPRGVRWTRWPPWIDHRPGDPDVEELLHLVDERSTRPRGWAVRPLGAESAARLRPPMPTFDHAGQRLAYEVYGEGSRNLVLLPGLLLPSRMHEPLAARRSRTAATA